MAVPCLHVLVQIDSLLPVIGQSPEPPINPLSVLPRKQIGAGELAPSTIHGLGCFLLDDLARTILVLLSRNFQPVPAKLYGLINQGLALKATDYNVILYCNIIVISLVRE